MKLKLIIAAMMLTLAFPAAGDGAVVQQAYEVALSDLRLPRAEGGTIAFKECEKCDYLRLRVSASTTYRINGQAVPLPRFRTAMRDVADSKNQAVTVLHHLRLNQVTDVSVNL
jgi:hypothetical protein